MQVPQAPQPHALVSTSASCSSAPSNSPFSTRLTISCWKRARAEILLTTWDFSCSSSSPGGNVMYTCMYVCMYGYEHDWVTRGVMTSFSCNSASSGVIQGYPGLNRVIQGCLGQYYSNSSHRLDKSYSGLTRVIQGYFG